MLETIVSDGFAFVEAKAMRELLERSGSLNDWDIFSESWNDLVVDTHMADKGRYRKRRYAVYKITDDQLVRDVHQPHYQTTDYNSLNGGIQRWFEPILPHIGNSQSLITILHFCHKLFGSFMPKVRSWHIEIHQFRIEAGSQEKGQPTPEGMHRDGVDYVLVLMIRRQNIASGVTSIHDLEHRQLGSFTLTEPYDAALVDDTHVYHGVTAVMPLKDEIPAYRDVLVVTFRHQ